MLATFPSPSDLEAQYFQILQGIKPDFNPNNNLDDFFIRGRVIARIISGIYGDQSKVDNDTYVSSARPEALTAKGVDLNLPQQPASYALSPQIRVFGTVGTPVPITLVFQYVPTGIQYQATTSGVINGSGYFDIAIQALTAGQIGNVLSGALQVVSPPTGIGPSATIEQSIGDGSDIESTDSYRARILSRLQNPPAGGNETDYPAFAFAASTSVRTATIKRFGRGLGTVDVYITSGTTDVDTAVTQGLSIVRVPTNTLLNTVQAYYNAHVPLTDCPEIFGPTEIPLNVTLNYVLASGITLTTVPADPVNNPLSLTVHQLLDREVGRALYKVPVGGVIRPDTGLGYVLASAIEQSLDVWLSAQVDANTQQTIGKIPVLLDRQVQPLNSPAMDYQLAANAIVAPGVVSLVAGV